MKVIDPGHVYSLSSYAGENEYILNFIHKEPDEENKLVIEKDGTTNEEVLEMLLHRLKWLQNRLPSRETAIAITKIEEALLWLNRRTSLRMIQNVENTMKPHY